MTTNQLDAERQVDEHVASALRSLIGDRNVRRYLCLHHPEDLHRAQHALDAWDADQADGPPAARRA